MGLYEHWPYANFHELNLDWIIKEMKTVRDEYAEVQQLVIDLEDLRNKYIEVYALYDKLVLEFSEFKKSVDEDMTAFQDSITLQMQQQMNLIETTLQGFSDRLTLMNIKLDNAIENLSSSLKVFNPFTGEEESIESVIYMLASFHMQDAITAGEYDGLSLTAGYYDGLALTAYQYDVEAKTYLMP